MLSNDIGNMHQCVTKITKNDIYLLVIKSK